MFLKIMAALPGYIYAHDQSGVYVNLFIGGDAELTPNGSTVCLTQKTNYPWDGRISITVSPEKSKQFVVYVRVPGWARGIENPGGLYRSDTDNSDPVVIRVNRRKIPLELERGYARIERRWRDGDQVTLEIPMPIRRVFAHEQVEADQGKVALMRGPLVYCLESLDQPTDIHAYVLKSKDSLKTKHHPEFMDGATIITGEAWRLDPATQKQLRASIKAIPFYTQCNRHFHTQLLTWLPETS